MFPCREAFVQLRRLNLTKRTVDKRQKARSMLYSRRNQAVAQQAAADNAADKTVPAASIPEPVAVADPASQVKEGGLV